MEESATGRTTGFAGRLRRKRLDLGLSQSALAARVGSHQPTVSAWESGIELPSRDVLVRLSETLGERVDFLLHGTDGAGELEDLVLRVLDRIGRKDLELLASVDPKILGGWLIGLRTGIGEAAKSPTRRR